MASQRIAILISAGALVVLWLVCALGRLQLTPFAPVASRSATQTNDPGRAR